jgi:hypothetical protein
MIRGKCRRGKDCGLWISDCGLRNVDRNSHCGIRIVECEGKTNGALNKLFIFDKILN